MQRGEFSILQRLFHHDLWITRDELDDGWWETGFQEYFVEKVVGVSCGGGRFPYHNVAD